MCVRVSGVKAAQLDGGDWWYRVLAAATTSGLGLSLCWAHRELGDVGQAVCVGADVDERAEGGGAGLGGATAARRQKVRLVAAKGPPGFGGVLVPGSHVPRRPCTAAPPARCPRPPSPPGKPWAWRRAWASTCIDAHWVVLPAQFPGPQQPGPPAPRHGQQRAARCEGRTERGKTHGCERAAGRGVSSLARDEPQGERRTG